MDTQGLTLLTSAEKNIAKATFDTNDTATFQERLLEAQQENAGLLTDLDEQAEQIKEQGETSREEQSKRPTLNPSTEDVAALGPIGAGFLLLHNLLRDAMQKEYPFVKEGISGQSVFSSGATAPATPLTPAELAGETTQKGSKFLSELESNFWTQGSESSWSTAILGIKKDLVAALPKVLGVASLAAGLLWGVTDAIQATFKAEDWGTSTVSAAVAGFIAGDGEGGLQNAFANAGKWALMGAGVGSVVPVVGTLAGGIVGAALGGIFGWVGAANWAVDIDILLANLVPALGGLFAGGAIGFAVGGPVGALAGILIAAAVETAVVGVHKLLTARKDKKQAATLEATAAEMESEADRKATDGTTTAVAKKEAEREAATAKTTAETGYVPPVVSPTHEYIPKIQSFEEALNAQAASQKTTTGGSLQHEVVHKPAVTTNTTQGPYVTFASYMMVPAASEKVVKPVSVASSVATPSYPLKELLPEEAAAVQTTPSVVNAPVTTSTINNQVTDQSISSEATYIRNQQNQASSSIALTQTMLNALPAGSTSIIIPPATNGVDRVAAPVNVTVQQPASPSAISTETYKEKESFITQQTAPELHVTVQPDSALKPALANLAAITSRIADLVEGLKPTNTTVAPITVTQTGSLAALLARP
jgi:antitoxin component of MazEF toxin-antitoxin module